MNQQNAPFSSPNDQQPPPNNNTTPLQHVIINQTPVAPHLFAKRRRGRPVLDKADRHCENCGVTDTPEWRRGPTGPHTLCNACGIHYLKKSKRLKKEPSPLRRTLILPRFIGTDSQHFSSPSSEVNEKFPPFLPSLNYNIQQQHSDSLLLTSPNQSLVNPQNDSPFQLASQFQFFSHNTPPFFPSNFVQNIYENFNIDDSYNNFTINSHSTNYLGQTNPPLAPFEHNLEVTPPQISLSYNQHCHQVIAQRLQPQQAQQDPGYATFMPPAPPTHPVNEMRYKQQQRCAFRSPQAHTKILRKCPAN